MTKFMIRIIIFRRYKYLLSRYLLSTAPTSVIGEENRGVKVRIKLSRYSLGKRQFRIIAIFVLFSTKDNRFCFNEAVLDVSCPGITIFFIIH